MKIAILLVLAFVAFASALPWKSNVYFDIYRSVLNNPLSRVYQGKDASKGQFKHQASIRWGFLGIKAHICGGSLIGDRTVVTAAHCKVYKIGSYDVVLGHLSVIGHDGQVFKVKEFITHPGYPGGSAVSANDIAIVNLAKPVQSSNTIDIIKVETENCDVSEKELNISGFGQTSKSPLPSSNLKYDVVRGISYEKCAEDLTALLGSQGPLDKTMVCSSSYKSEYQGACAGDSGGPLTLDGVLVGITSWGISPCGTPKAPSVFTSPCAHVDFINKHKL